MFCLRASDRLSVWFDQPAKDWNEALPIGNGRIGAMVFGGVPVEQLQLNDNTLYSGEPGDRDLPLDVGKGLDQVQEWLKEGKYAEVHAWVSKHWLGRAQNCYQPLGSLWLDFPSGGTVTNYRRELDINNAVVKVSYDVDGTEFTREVFASHPANAIIMRLHASKPGALHFTIRLDSVHPTAQTEVVKGKSTLCMKGQVPGFALRRDIQIIQKNGDTWKYPEIFDSAGKLKAGASQVLYGDKIGNKGTRFEAELSISSQDGQCIEGNRTLTIQNATDVVLILTTGSSYAGFNKSPSREGADEHAEALAPLSPACAKSFDELKSEHVSDYKSLFDRVTLNLGESSTRDSLPTSERIQQYSQKGDEKLAELYYQFGRYLIISGSRSGGQPLNLQGMWNPDVIPPWAGAYTLNINLEMNYWPVEVANLSECGEPLFRLIQELHFNGEKVAHDMYGLPGWVAHHNTTIWRDAQPVDGDAGPAFWNMAGPWLCQHLWNHYVFTNDQPFLRDQAYPIMKGAAEFMSAWLVMDKDGHLVTPVGGSPENRFLYRDSNGQQKGAALIAGPTMDIALIRELFTNCIQASEILNIDSTFREQLRTQLGRLLPYKIGSQGRLQEWPLDFADEEPTHRHVSHLYGLFPGNQIALRATPDLAAAARRTLELRGDLSTGWSLAWKINLWAHLRQGDRAYRCLALLLSPERTYPNLFDSCPPFQIDGNLGATSGIEEMLLQSQPGEIDLLPALPENWVQGSFSGLKAKGNIEVGCDWASGRLVSVALKGEQAVSCRVRYGNQVVSLNLNPNQKIQLDGQLQLVQHN